MKLALDSRPVGDVLIVECQGRIVAGNEVLRLHAVVGDAIAKYGAIVLHLERVEFIDSSGLGALMRLLQAARAKKGDVKLCRVPANIRKTLEMTHLYSQFEAYDTQEEAITAAYLGSRYSPGLAGDVRPRVLCLYESQDVCAFLRELLCTAGYNPLTALNIDDAKILLKATKAKLVLVSSRMQSVYGKPTRQALQEIDPAVAFIALDEDFAAQDPGEAAEKLLHAVHEIEVARKTA